MSEVADAGLRTFHGAVAIITGGASGIGEAFALELASRGAIVVIADLDGGLAAQVAGTIREKGGDATHTLIDVSDYAAMSELVTETFCRHGRLDFMFNLVGIIYSGTALDYSIEDWSRVLDVNIRGVVNGVQAAYPVMVEQGFGHVVNMSSMAGLVPFYNVPYTASRFAVVGLTLSLRQEASMLGVRVTLLCPGAVRTLTFSDSGNFGKQLRNLPAEEYQAMLERLGPIDPTRYVRVALRGIARNRAMIVAPYRARYFWRSYRRTPLLTSGLAFNHLVKPILLKAEEYDRMAAEDGGREEPLS